MKLWKGLLGALALSLNGLPASAAEEIGAAVVVVNQVTAALDADTRTLESGHGVHQNELIEVAKDASSELKLNDDTKMALGPGAKLKLDKFVYDPQQTNADIAVNLVKGAFRFVTGVAAKPSYVVRVPQASITVRGTIFDAYVEDSGASWLLLHEGAVEVCNAQRKCQLLDEPGKLLRISDGRIEPPARWNKLKRKASFNDAFPFVEKKPQESPPVLTREAIFIDIDLPPKKPKVKDRTPGRDHAKHNDRRKPKTKPKRKAESKPKKTKKRRVAKDNDSEKVLRALGAAAAIYGGIRIGRGGGGGKRPGGGGDHPRPHGRTAN